MKVTAYLQDGTKEKYNGVDTITEEFGYLYLDMLCVSVHFISEDVKRITVKSE